MVWKDKDIVTLIIGGLGVVVGWWEWNAIKMWTWSVIEIFMTLFLLLPAAVIVFFLLLLVLFIVFSAAYSPPIRPPTLMEGIAWLTLRLALFGAAFSPPHQTNFMPDIQEIQVLLLLSCLLSVLPPPWAWGVIKMLMNFLFLVIAIIRLLLLLFVLFAIYVAACSPPPRPPTLVEGIQALFLLLGISYVLPWWAWGAIKIFLDVVIVVLSLFVIFVVARSPPPPRPLTLAEGIQCISSFLNLCSLQPPLQSSTTPTTSSTLSVCGPPARSTSSTPISTWSTQEKYEATALAFSVITGLKLISEKDVQGQRMLGKKVTPLDIKDVFYGRLSSSQTQADHQELFYIPDSAYDPQYDHDFTNYNGDDSYCTRGGYPYKRPAGWNRKAVRVIGKYEDDVWLGEPGLRDKSSPGEWAVSYHGTKIQNVSSIVADGYDRRRCVRQLYGPGIYSTPDPKVAEGYATNFNYKGVNFKCILQNRVNRVKTTEHKTYNGIYFVTADEDDIRPYGVCIKKI